MARRVLRLVGFSLALAGLGILPGPANAICCVCPCEFISCNDFSTTEECGQHCDSLGCASATFLPGTCADRCGYEPVTPSTAGTRCQAAKLRAAGKYADCRLKEAARAAMKGTAPDYSKCFTRFQDNWRKWEAQFFSECPSALDGVAIEAAIAQHTSGLAAAIAGGSLPPCP